MEAYEKVPTVPGWDRPGEGQRPRPGPGARLLLYAVALLVAVLLTAVVGALAPG